MSHSIIGKWLEVQESIQKKDFKRKKKKNKTKNIYDGILWIKKNQNYIANHMFKNCINS